MVTVFEDIIITSGLVGLLTIWFVRAFGKGEDFLYFVKHNDRFEVVGLYITYTLFYYQLNIWLVDASKLTIIFVYVLSVYLIHTLIGFRYLKMVTSKINYTNYNSNVKQDELKRLNESNETGVVVVKNGEVLAEGKLRMYTAKEDDLQIKVEILDSRLYYLNKESGHRSTLVIGDYVIKEYEIYARDVNVEDTGVKNYIHIQVNNQN